MSKANQGIYLSNLIIRVLPKASQTLRKLSTNKFGSSLHQLKILHLIQEGNNQAQISLTLQISGAAVSKSLKTLQNLQLVQKTKADDKRTYKLVVTDSGRRILDQVHGQLIKKLGVAIEKLSADEKMALTKGLDVLNKLLSLL